MLYSVSFSTQHNVSVFNKRGEKTHEYTDKIPQRMTGLPHSTAMQYAKCDDFAIETYYMDPTQQPRSAARKSYAEGSHSGKPSVKAKGKPAYVPRAHSHAAAASGDLSAAINKD